MVAVMLMADRAIPANVRRMGGRSFRTTPEEFWKKYGLVAFPRTLFAVFVCLAASLDLVIPISVDAQGFVLMAFIFLYCASSAADIFRARL
jgi:hypothetical protein